MLGNLGKLGQTLPRFAISVFLIPFPLLAPPRLHAVDRSRGVYHNLLVGILNQMDAIVRTKTPVPMTQGTTTVLRNCLKNHWKENPQGFAVPEPRSGGPRVNVVKFGLRPILKKLGLPTRKAGMHAFRHGLGTALANAGVSPAVVQRTLRHTDIQLCGSTSTRTIRRNAKHSRKFNHYSCRDYYSFES
jgi:hypothetical protein